MGAGDQLTWTAALTDSILFPPDQLCEWRDNQANELIKAVNGRSPEEIKAVLAHRSLPWHLARIRGNGKASLPSPHFVEFLFVLPRVIGDAVQAAIDAYDGPTWADEFDQLMIRIDDSSAAKAKTQLKDLLKPILSGPSLALRPPKLGGGEHPLFAKHQRGGRTGDLRSLIGNRIDFVDSKEEPLCQLADVVAWTLRRAADLPHDAVAADLHRRLRPRQHGIEGSRGIRIMSARGVPDVASDRYRHIAAMTRYLVPERKVLTP